MSFTCSEPFVDSTHGLEWVCLSVNGQSFLFNQIRKMVGLAIDVVRSSKCLDSTISFDKMDRSFSPSHKIEIPTAPGLGLYLQDLYYDRYNIKLDQEAERRLRCAFNKEEKKRLEVSGNFMQYL
jgi:tRNA pseudouridine38-40 synthase